MFTFIFLAIAATSQAEALFAGAVPMDIPTFMIVIKGSEPFYAGIKVDGRWVTENSAEFTAIQELELYHDDPWNTAAPYRILRRRIKELKYETSAMRRQRLESMWTERGYTFQQTASGWQPVSKEDKIYADRTRQMIQAAAAAKAAAVAPPSSGTTTPDGNTSSYRWKDRNVLIGIGVVLTSLVGLFLVTKKLILSDADQ